MKTSRVLLLWLLIVSAAYIFPDQATATSKNGSDVSGLLSKEVTEPIELTIAGASGMEIVLEHRFGHLDIRTGQSNRIYVKGEKKLTAKDSRITGEFLSGMRLIVTERPNRVKIVTEYPDDDDLREKVRNFSISYTIEVPPNVTLNAESSFGDIDIVDVSGTITISGGYGKITARTVNGDTSLKNKFGSIQASTITGNAIIANSHGSLDIGQINGNLRAETKFGSLTVNGVKGSAELANEHGRVTCSDISGDTGITTSFGLAECRIIGGRSTVYNSHGSVRVENVDHDVKITTSFGKVTANTIKGALTVENQHGSVEAEFVDGDADIRTTFGSVQVDRIGGNVQVTDQHGSITALNILQGASETKRTVRLKTSHASIRVAMPETFSATINVSTSFGKIKCDFPILMNLGNVGMTSSNRSQVNGTVGDGKDTLELEASFANITIEKI